jgi:hypothetical protein
MSLSYLIPGTRAYCTASSDDDDDDDDDKTQDVPVRGVAYFKKKELQSVCIIVLLTIVIL